MSDSRSVAQQMAAEDIAAGSGLGWFDRFYAAADRGEIGVPWADMAPNPMLCSWEALRRLSGRAAVVGCGLGDDAEFLADRGMEVTAFDISPTAVGMARLRFDKSSVSYVAADLLDLPADWNRGFDFVFEAYTIQVLQGEQRRKAIANVARLVAPGGTLLVIARARDESGEPGKMPWPLTRDEILAIPLRAVSVEDLVDDEEPPVRRWRAEFAAD